MSRHNALFLEAIHAVYACVPENSPLTLDEFPRIIGVDRLTGVTLEARVALEATRA